MISPFHMCRHVLPFAFILTQFCTRLSVCSACVRISRKYERLSDRDIFQASDVCSSGVIGRDADAFIARLDHLATSVSGERHEAKFVHRKLLLTMVRGNARSVVQVDRPYSMILAFIVFL